MPDGFDLSDALGAAPPFFVRKVDRKGHWETPERILENVFRVDTDGTISVYRVEGSSDLMRIAVALNANRVASNPAGASLTEDIFLVAIRENEFMGIELQQIEGLTDCIFANRRHFGARFPHSETEAYDRRARLVNALLAAGRRPKKLSKGRLAPALEEAKRDGCHAVVEDSEKCACEEAE